MDTEAPRSVEHKVTIKPLNENEGATCECEERSQAALLRDRKKRYSAVR